MKHKVKVRAPVEKRGLFGSKKTVMETRTLQVDEKTRRALQKEKDSRPYSMEEMMLYDELFDED